MSLRFLMLWRYRARDSRGIYLYFLYLRVFRLLIICRRARSFFTLKNGREVSLRRGAYGAEL